MRKWSRSSQVLPDCTCTSAVQPELAPQALALTPSSPPPSSTPTPPPLIQDRARCDELYRQAKASVQDGIAYLLEQRRRDPYGAFLPRQLYEAAYPGRQAPTFPVQ